MKIHTWLINSFPSQSKEHVKIEILERKDFSTSKIVEVVEKYLDIHEYVTLVEEKIDNLNLVPKIIINYPIGEALVLEPEQEALTYEDYEVHIKFGSSLFSVEKLNY